jgi:CheY-specific phosphatase CheX
MISQYFAQYLLNTAALQASQVQSLLSKASEHKAQLLVLAMNDGLITAKQIESIQEKEKLQNKTFAEIALADGYLTKSQLSNVENSIINNQMNFVQTMLDEHIVDYVQMEQFLKEYSESKIMPIDDAVRQLAGKCPENVESECEHYSEYAEIFMRSLVRFMDTSAVINPVAIPFSGEKPTVVISQRLMGDMIMTTGILAEEDVFLEMARRYSQEDIAEVDELAIDSVSEFLNVANGLYVVNLAHRHLEVDLEPQRMAKNVTPAGNQQMIIRIDTGFGPFDLIIATDEFLLLEDGQGKQL